MIPPGAAFSTGPASDRGRLGGMRAGRRRSRSPPAGLGPVGMNLVIARQGRADVRVAGARVLGARHVHGGDVVADPVQILDIAGPSRPADAAAERAAESERCDERPASPPTSHAHAISPLTRRSYKQPQMQ